MLSKTEKVKARAAKKDKDKDIKDGNPMELEINKKPSVVSGETPNKKEEQKMEIEGG